MGWHRIAPVFGLVMLVWTLGAGQAAEVGEYQGPCAVVVLKEGTSLAVANADARQVAWIELPSGKTTRRVDVPAEPTGLALSPDGTKLIVTCAAPKSTVAVLDASTGEWLTTIQAGHTAIGPAISPDGKRLYVCNRFDNDVSVIDLAAGREVARVPAVREPIAAAVTPDGQSVVVANHLPCERSDDPIGGEVAAAVTLIDAQTFQTTTINLLHGANGLRSLCILPDGKHALVTHLLSNFQQIPFRVDMGWINVNVVSILDLKQRKVIATIGLDEYDLGTGNPWGVACSPDGKTVCVSVAGTHELCVIGRDELLGEFARRTMQPMMGVWPIYLSLGESLWRRIQLPGKGPRGLAMAGSRAYLAEYFSDTVAVVEWQPGEAATTSSIPVGPQPKLTEVRRGEMLFHDATICYQKWQSCASCHPDGRVDGLNWDLANDGVGNAKNTKSMLWAHRTPPAMAASVRESAEDAVRSGLEHILFAQRPEEEAVAIDAYLKSLRPVPSPRLVDGRLSVSAERGQKLFESPRVGCAGCHPAPLYTDLKAHNVGTRNSSEHTDRFDTPTLVEVWRTAPYLHDGRYRTLRELFVEGKHGLRRGPDDALSQQELDDLIAFVLSL